MATTHIPIFMRIGDGAEQEVGVIDMPVSCTATVTVTSCGVAAALRAAADEIEHPSSGEEATT
ncbi:hypothetical protein AB0M28_13490 [Streptomyces sp. NPDC051940]|uniref:hypothetical protein n=1 Tax=Streptomyces sp. NPDC051940 TaxID=3155675 RepID=UPI003435A5F4